MISIISNSTEDTMALGEKLASFLKKGDVVVLTGDLGARKNKICFSVYLNFLEKKMMFLAQHSPL